MFEEIIFPPTLSPKLLGACSTGNKSVLKKLISSLPSYALEQKDKLGRTPLILSTVYDHTDCVSLLLKAGVQVDNNDNKGQTALHAAAAKGFSQCVKLLLQHKASVQCRNFDGATPLHYAAISPNLKCLSRILKKLKPGEIDLQDATRKTPLHWSAAYACLEHLKMLLARDAHICIPDKEGKTPLHFVVLRKESKALEIVKILLDHESTLINWQDYGGRSALHLAVSSGSVEIVHHLIDTPPSTAAVWKSSKWRDF
ncbi:inversin-like [Uloborus diversus]|uniref:inversin-like n=1 Tax=Uloborus diversus TaxID=327109 RepID=UPI00240A6272|nr:inversin-like [Uloborus diversus]